MKYNNEILNEIVKISNQQNSLNLDNIANGYIEMFKKGAKIYIKSKNRGKFTRSARAAGQGVQEHARSVLKNPNSTTLQKRRARFAINSTKWHKK